MLRFMFWNINKKPLIEFISSLVRRHNIDVLILAESNLISPYSPDITMNIL